MTIRVMTLSDFPEVYLLWKSTNLPIKTFEEEQSEVEMMLKLNPTSCLVSIENNKIIGSIMGVFNGRRAWIYHLAIDPKFQHKGYGSQLLKKTEEALKKIGTPVVLLFVDKDNLDVVSFYTQNHYSIFNKSVVLRKEF